MSTIDQIAVAKERYLSSARSHVDWFIYVTTVERLRRAREGH